MGLIRKSHHADQAVRRRHLPQAAAWLLFVVVTGTLLNLPDHPDALKAEFFLRLPLEVPALAVLLLLVGRRWQPLAAGLVTLLAALILFLKLADIGTQAAFQRPFNPYLDGKMLVDGWNIAAGNLGQVTACLIVAAALVLFFALMMLYRMALGTIGRTRGTARHRMLSASLVVLVAAGALKAFSGLPGLPVTAEAPRYLAARLQLVAAAVRDLRAFDRELAQAAGPASGKGLFSAVKGRDVILVFVESYGRSAIEDPRYAPEIRPRLAGIEEDLAGKGFASASGWVTSPTVGGLSWLAHGTLLSGLWTDSQARYDRLMISSRPSLNRLFAEAGWESVAVMPAITMDWPQSAYFGYDRVLAAADLGYRGKPFNWITMPDQYTLSAFQRLVRDRPGRRPVMAQVVLISSHAPWTPVAHLVDWDAIGDGRIFDRQAEGDEPPAVVWADPDNIRRHYVDTVDYSLAALGSYIARDGGDALFLIIGDHQPAAVVTGPDASRAVPLHVVSRDRALVARFEADGLAPGLLPPPSLPERRMDGLRDRLIRLLGQQAR